MVRLIEPTYFPPISHWKFIKSKDLSWSINSRYNKQTLTNRTYIDSANGELMLTVPIKHSGKNQPRVYSDIKLDLSSDWKKNHFKSIKICYQSSPFYEFYEDDLISFFNLDYENLYDLNLKSIKMVCNWLKIKMPEDIYNEKYKIKWQKDKKSLYERPSYQLIAKGPRQSSARRFITKYIFTKYKLNDNI